MVVGESGLGKSTFVDCFLETVTTIVSYSCYNNG